MATKIYTNNYPTTKNTQTEMEDLINGVDKHHASQMNSIKDMCFGLQDQVGSDLEESGSLRQRVTTLEGAGGGGGGIVNTQVGSRDTRMEYVSVTSVRANLKPGGAFPISFKQQDNVTRELQAAQTADITAGVGEGGLDQGSETGSTWYYLYLIPSAADNNVLVAILSTIHPGSGGPSGYTNFTYCGAVRNNSLSNFEVFLQHGPDTWFSFQQTLVSSAAADGGPVAFDPDIWVPRTAIDVHLFSVAGGNATASVNIFYWVDTLQTLGGAFAWQRQVITANAVDSRNFSIPVSSGNVPKIFQYQKSVGAGALTFYELYTLGFRDNYLGG